MGLRLRYTSDESPHDVTLSLSSGTGSTSSFEVGLQPWRSLIWDPAASQSHLSKSLNFSLGDLPFLTAALLRSLCSSTLFSLPIQAFSLHIFCILIICMHIAPLLTDVFTTILKALKPLNKSLDCKSTVLNSSSSKAHMLYVGLPRL